MEYFFRLPSERISVVAIEVDHMCDRMLEKDVQNIRSHNFTVDNSVFQLVVTVKPQKNNVSASVDVSCKLVFDLDVPIVVSIVFKIRGTKHVRKIERQRYTKNTRYQDFQYFKIID